MKVSEISAVANSINETHRVNLSTFLFSSILFFIIPIDNLKIEQTENQR